MHFIVTINEKRKVKLTWLALSKVCVYVFVYSGFMTSQIAKPHFKDQITRHLENKADRKYPKQPQEVHASITSFSFLRYNIVKLHLDLRLTYFEEKKKLWQSSIAMILARAVKIYCKNLKLGYWFKKCG